MSSQEIEEIKNRLNVAEVLGEYIRLTKAGSNWKALCPFHNEKTPSFMVSEERGSWHCFGCGKGGDIFSFIMELEGVGFPEALAQLAEKAGVELKRFEGTSHGTAFGKEADKDDKKTLFSILELATKWYEKNLWEGKGKEKILTYLRQRGLSDESIKKFRLGYAPDGWRNIFSFLQKRGFNMADIEKTGLLVKKEKIPNSKFQISNEIQNSNDKFQNLDFYDRFRERIMFPIQDILGRVVGYSARVAPGGDEKNAKYINTPQTALYDKSKILYGLNFAKMEIKKNNEAVLVEGNTDVIAAHQAGFANTIAVSGTALTDQQVKIIKRYGENLKMGFDMDPAGQAAARRSIKVCLENELNVKIITLSSGKDAAESLREDPAVWKKSVESAEGVMEYYFKEAFSRYDPKKPADKKKIAQELLNVIKDISNPIEQSHWMKMLAERIGTDEKILSEVLQRARSKNQPGSAKEKNVAVQNDRANLEKKLLGIILVFFPNCRKEIASLKAEDFQNERERAIIEAIKRDEENFSLERIKALFSDYETRKFLEETAFEAEVRFGGELGGTKDKLDPVEELQGYVRQLKKRKRKEKVLQITREIKSAEANGDKVRAKLLAVEFQRMMEEGDFR